MTTLTLNNHFFFRKSSSELCRLAMYLLLLTITTEALADMTDPEQSKKIVVTIKPLYSLVAHLTTGINKPILLLKNLQSPHHYNIRPSERRLLAKANTIIWLGPQLEPQLKKIIQQQDKPTDSTPAIIISAIQAKNLKLLNKRGKHTHEENHSSSNKHPETNVTDPHIWLSTHNAAQISKHINTILISHDPKNAERYQQNLVHLLSKIEHTQNFIKTKLKNNKQAFIAFHDAFQYFEEEFGLNYIDAINYGDETGSSLKHLHQIKNLIEKNNIQCLVYQPPKAAVINTLIKETGIKAVELDPTGVNINDKKNTWFKLMQQISANFNTCLNP